MRVKWLDLQKARILRPNQITLRSLTTDDKIKLPLELGIFVIDGEDDAWKSSFKDLIKYCSKYGNQACDIRNESKLCSFYRIAKYSFWKENKRVRIMKWIYSVLIDHHQGQYF